MGLFKTPNKRSGDTDVLAAATPLKDIPAPTEVPLDSEVVHNTGNENVDGSKFFRDQTYFGDSTAYVSIKSNGDIIKKASGSTTLTTYSLPSGGGTFAMKSDVDEIAANMDSLISGLDDAILLLDGWNGVFAESWTLTMNDGTTQTRVVLNQQEESNG